MTTKNIKIGKNAIKFRYIFFAYLLLSFLLIAFLFSERQLSYMVLTRFISLEDENVVLYDYYVYATDRRFAEGLEKDVNKAVVDLQKRGEGIVVKIKGDSKVVKHDNYILVYNERVPEMNIEIYIAKNVEFSFASLPFRTLENLFEDILSILIIFIYLVLFEIDIFLCCVDIIKKQNKRPFLY